MTQRLYFLRHTPTAMPPGSCYGFRDVPLADDYSRDLAAVRERLRAADPELETPRVFSSPLTRCRRLAEDILDVLNIVSPPPSQNSVVLDERLKELNFGEWEGRAWDDIQASDGARAEAWMASFVETPCPGGESYRDLAERTHSFLEDLATGDEAVLVVAHGGSIRALLARLLGLELDYAFRLEIDYGRLSRVDRNPGAPGMPARLLYLNR